MRILVFIAVAFLGAVGNAQEKKISVKGTRNQDKSVTLQYTKTVPGSYTIKIVFKKLENCMEGDFTKTIHGNTGTLITLKPTNPKQGISYSYSYSYTQGVKKPKIDNDYPYLLPFTTGTKVSVNATRSIREQYFGEERQSKWNAYRFRFEKETTVCAIRKGTVVKIVDEYEVANNENAFSTENNSVTVEHKDGTFVRYNILKKGSILVKLGTTVYPQTPIGKSGHFSEDDKNKAGLMLYYRDLSDFGTDAYNSKAATIYLTPKFYVEPDKKLTALTPKTSYTAITTPDILEKEMSKRERKKRNKK